MTKPTATFPPAMVLAAGLGTRMRPLTDTLPKPLVRVAGETLLDRTLDHLKHAGANRVVINCHHHAEVLKDHVNGLSSNMELIISDETDALLDTGGGVCRALSKLGNDAFCVINGDALWMDPPSPAIGTLEALWSAWDDAKMDGLLLLVPRADAHGFDGNGDFFLGDDGRTTRRGDNDTAPFVFAGVQILHSRAFRGAQDGTFSLNRIYNEALDRGRLFGTVMSGTWMHVGTPDAIGMAEQVLANGNNAP